MVDIYQRALKKIERAIENSKYILVVDDEDLFRSFLKMFFEGDGFHVYEAANGQEGLEVFEANPHINIIVTDIQMPIMSGVEFVKRIRKINPKLPVIIVTGFIEDARKIIESSWATIIGKPLDLDELENAIESHLSK